MLHTARLREIFPHVAGFITAFAIVYGVNASGNYPDIFPLDLFSGIGTFFLIVFGPRSLASLFLGCLLSFLLKQKSWDVSGLMSAMYCAEFYLASYLFNRILYFEHSLEQKKTVAFLLSALIPALISATLINFAFPYPNESMSASVIHWANLSSAKVLGILSFAPLGSLLREGVDYKFNSKRLVLLLSLMASSVVVSIIAPSPSYLIFQLPLLLLIARKFTSWDFKLSLMFFSLSGAFILKQNYESYFSGNLILNLSTVQIYLATILFSGIALRSYRFEKARNYSTIAYLSGWLITFIIAITFSQTLVSGKKADVEALKKNFLQDIRKQLDLHIDLLEAGRAFVMSSKDVSKEEWKTFSESLMKMSNKEILGLGFIAVKEFAGNIPLKPFSTSLLPSTKTHAGYIVTKFYTTQIKLDPVGVDISTEPRRRNAVEEARDSGELIRLPDVVFNLDGSTYSGMLLYLPVYKSNLKNGDLSERKNNFLGVVFIPIVYEGFFERLTSGISPSLGVAFYDESNGKNRAMYTNFPGHVSETTTLEKIEFGNRPILLKLQSKSAITASPNLVVSWVMFAGAIVTALLGMLVQLQENLFRRATEIAGEKTAELEKTEKEILSLNQGLEDRIARRTFDLEELIASLSRSEESFRELANSMPQIVWRTDHLGLPEYFNDRWYQFSGFKKEQEFFQQTLKITHPDERPRFENIWKSSLMKPKPFEFELRLWDYQAQMYRWFLCQASPVFDTSGSPKNWYGTFTDIHERKLLELEGQKFIALIERSPEAIILADEDFRIIYFNETAHSYFGLVNSIPHDLLSLFKEEDLHTRISPALQDQYFWVGEADLGLPGKKEKISTFSNFFVIREKKTARFIAYSLIAQDITELRESEKERTALKAREDAANEASRMKSEFLASMSHEIRTPISGILGLLEVLKDRGISDEQAPILFSMEASAKHLHSLISDILDLSKIESGKIVLETEIFNLGKLLDETCEMFQAEGRKKNINLRTDFDQATRQDFAGDALRIRQILVNLLSNAVKFSSEGEIVITVYESHTHPGGSEIHFSVRDEGIGIAQEKVKGLFENFSQADASIQRKFGGTGLGLAICKRFVELMGGKIGVKSDLGKGSTFWFTVNLRKITGVISSPDKTPKTERKEFDGKLVLIAEDHPVNQHVLRHYVETMGARVEIANNGFEAVRKFESLSPDLILMDCQMPDLDGIEATKKIRELDKFHVPIIGITANAFREDEERCRNAGMSDFLPKPVDRNKLFEKMSHHLKMNASAPVDADLMPELEKIFSESTAKSLSIIETSILKRDEKGIAFEAHKLKSSTRLLGRIKASEICLELEKGCLSPDWNYLEELLKKLRSELKTPSA